MSKTRTEFVASLRDMNPRELEDKISDLRGEICLETGIARMYGMSYAEKGKGGVAMLRLLKRELARALTIQQERKKGINQ